jgi:hypothetical protein
MGLYGGSPKDNSAKVAKTQAEIAKNQLKFDREEADRQSIYRDQILAQQRVTDDRRYALDLKADERATLAGSFNQTMAQQQLAYQQQKDAQLYGLQKQQLDYAEADRSFYRERATREEQQITSQRAAQEAKEAARLASGTAGYDPFKQSIETQLRSGLINFQQAQDYLKDYTTKYDLTGKEGELGQFAKLYSEQIAPTRFATGLEGAYEEILGRKATEEEKATGIERFKGGYYQTVTDLKESLYKGQEYQKKFNKSYLDSYYDTTFGKESKDAEGAGTGKRTFKFDRSLLPTYAEDLSSRTKVNLPNFADQFEGTPAELEQQLQNVRDSRQFLYGAGLTNLQGEIDKETQKLKNEGAKEIQKIAAQGDIYKSLVGSFSF